MNSQYCLGMMFAGVRRNAALRSACNTTPHCSSLRSTLTKQSVDALTKRKRSRCRLYGFSHGLLGLAAANLLISGCSSRQISNNQVPAVRALSQQTPNPSQLRCLSILWQIQQRRSRLASASALRVSVQSLLSHIMLWHFHICWHQTLLCQIDENSATPGQGF